MKGQSNLEIARTPRNAFRCSLGHWHREVERLIRCEGFAAYQVLTNSECPVLDPGSEGAGAKVRVRKRNNSDRRLRPPSAGRVEGNNGEGPQRQLGCWLGSSHSVKVCVTAHQSSGPAWIIIGHKPAAEAMDVARHGRGAFHGRRRRASRRSGAHGKANVGISNDKGGGKPPRRKTKGF